MTTRCFASTSLFACPKVFFAEMVSPGVLIVSAPSGAGKTSLTRALVASRENVGLTVSHTTRPMRSGEEDGVHYHFVNHAIFEQMAEDGLFVEHALVFGNRYGTSIQAIEERLAEGKHAILEIDWQGARRVRQAFPAAVSVFVMPPSLEALEQRLRDRGQDSDGVIANRMQAARSEISHKDEFDQIIVNDNFDQALAQLTAAIDGI